jgi:hypothetical protein
MHNYICGFKVSLRHSGSRVQSWVTSSQFDLATIELIVRLWFYYFGLLSSVKEEMQNGGIFEQTLKIGWVYSMISSHYKWTSEIDLQEGLECWRCREHIFYHGYSIRDVPTWSIHTYHFWSRRAESQLFLHLPRWSSHLCYCWRVGDEHTHKFMLFHVGVGHLHVHMSNLL